MSRTVYLNGEFVPEAQAQVSVFDRGYLFADAVYEVTCVLRGGMVDNDRHLARLQRSLDALQIPLPLPLAKIIEIQRELIVRNALQEGVVYLQVSRGVADRDFKLSADGPPTLVMFTQAKDLIDSPLAARGMDVLTAPDLRWRRRDIKSTGLLAQSMARQLALEAGAHDVWMTEEGFVTEGSSSNAWVVMNDAQGEPAIFTRHLSHAILHGITRQVVLALCEELSLAVHERKFTVEQAIGAQEAFATSAGFFVHPVVKIDGHVIGNGKPGPIASRLRAIYLEHALAQVT